MLLSDSDSEVEDNDANPESIFSKEWNLGLKRFDEEQSSIKKKQTPLWEKYNYRNTRKFFGNEDEYSLAKGWLKRISEPDPSTTLCLIIVGESGYGKQQLIERLCYEHGRFLKVIDVFESPKKDSSNVLALESINETEESSPKDEEGSEPVSKRLKTTSKPRSKKKEKLQSMQNEFIEKNKNNFVAQRIVPSMTQNTLGDSTHYLSSLYGHNVSNIVLVPHGHVRITENEWKYILQKPTNGFSDSGILWKAKSVTTSMKVARKSVVDNSKGALNQSKECKNIKIVNTEVNELEGFNPLVITAPEITKRLRPLKNRSQILSKKDSTTSNALVSVLYMSPPKPENLIRYLLFICQEEGINVVSVQKSNGFKDIVTASDGNFRKAAIILEESFRNAFLNKRQKVLKLEDIHLAISFCDFKPMLDNSKDSNPSLYEVPQMFAPQGDIFKIMRSMLKMQDYHFSDTMRWLLNIRSPLMIATFWSVSDQILKEKEATMRKKVPSTEIHLLEQALEVADNRVEMDLYSQQERTWGHSEEDTMEYFSVLFGLTMPLYKIHCLRFKKPPGLDYCFNTSFEQVTPHRNFLDNTLNINYFYKDCKTFDRNVINLLERLNVIAETWNSCIERRDKDVLKSIVQIVYKHRISLKTKLETDPSSEESIWSLSIETQLEGLNKALWDLDDTHAIRMFLKGFVFVKSKQMQKLLELPDEQKFDHCCEAILQKIDEPDSEEQKVLLNQIFDLFGSIYLSLLNLSKDSWNFLFRLVGPKDKNDLWKVSPAFQNFVTWVSNRLEVILGLMETFFVIRSKTLSTKRITDQQSIDLRKMDSKDMKQLKEEEEYKERTLQTDSLDFVPFMQTDDTIFI